LLPMLDTIPKPVTTTRRIAHSLFNSCFYVGQSRAQVQGGEHA
jgi:hypothetical protein